MTLTDEYLESIGFHRDGDSMKRHFEWHFGIMPCCSTLTVKDGAVYFNGHPTNITTPDELTTQIGYISRPDPKQKRPTQEDLKR